MASLSSLSVEDLKKELERREGALSGLYEKRQELEAQLKEVNDQIAAGGAEDGPADPPAGGDPSAGGDTSDADASGAGASGAPADPPKKRRGRPPGSKNKPKADGTKSASAGRKRPKNDKPLPAVLADVLGGKGPMALDDIHEAVVASGYKTSSKNFKNVIYQNLYNKDEFTKTGDGWVYKA